MGGRCSGLDGVIWTCSQFVTSPSFGGGLGLRCARYLLLTILVALPTARADDPPAGPRVDQYGDPLPEGAIARIGTTRFRGIWLSPGSLTPDEKTLVCCGRDGELHFVDAVTGKEHRKAKLTATQPADVAVSHDGARIAVSSAPDTPGGDSKVAVFDYQTCKEVFSFHVHVAPTLVAPLPVDSQRAAVGPPARPGDVFRPEFSRDDRCLVGFCGARSYRVYQADVSGGLLNEMDVPLARGYAREAELLAWIDSIDGHVLHVWDVRRWRSKHRWQLRGLGDGIEAHCAAISGDGKVVAVGWKPWPSDFHFHDGTEEATRADYTINVVDVDSGMWRRTIAGEGLLPKRLLLSRDGTWLVAAMADAFSEVPRFSRFWDTNTGQELWLSPKQVRSPRFFSRNGLRLYDGGNDMFGPPHIIVWDVRRAQRTIESPAGEIGHTEFSPDGTVLATSWEDGSISIFDSATWTALSETRARAGEFSAPKLTFSDAGRALVTYVDHNIEIRDAISQTVKTFIRVDGRRLSMLLGPPSGRVIAAVVGGSKTGDPRELRIYDFDSRVLTARVRLGPAQAVAAALFSPDGAQLAYTTALKTRDSKSRQTCVIAVGSGMARYLSTTARFSAPLAFSDDGMKLLSCADARSEAAGVDVVLIDLRDGTEVRRFGPFANGVDSAAISTGGQNTTVTVWRRATGGIVSESFDVASGRSSNLHRPPMPSVAGRSARNSEFTTVAENGNQSLLIFETPDGKER